MDTFYACSGSSVVMAGDDLKQLVEQGKGLVQEANMELCVWHFSRRIAAVIHGDGSVLLFGEFVHLGDW